MDRFYTTPVDRLSSEDFRDLVLLGLREDAPDGDITSESIFGPGDKCTATLIAKEQGILCGTAILDELLFQTRNNFAYTILSPEGANFQKGEKLILLSGSLLSILKIERVLLNFLQYLSGIASETNRIISRYGGKIQIFDTRKTIPGYRKLVKYAVYTGGGSNHRQNLSDMALIKDNHVAMSKSIIHAVKQVRDKHPEKKIELEIDSLSQLDEAISTSPEIILLDNFTIPDTITAIEKIRECGAPIRIECSGGITPQKLEEISNFDNIGVSMGYLTHTTRFLDLSLEIQRQ